MLAQIAEAGFAITAEPETADIVVINTCGFIAPARAEALEAISCAVDRKADGTVKKVIVVGCLPESVGTELFDQADGIEDYDYLVRLGEHIIEGEEAIPGSRPLFLVRLVKHGHYRVSDENQQFPARKFPG